jgi:ABC-type multidrug transport system ATPase subunit
MSSTSLLSVRGLAKNYFGKAVLENVSLELRAGRIHGLVGPEGAGKSTLLRLLTRAERADSGEGSILGADLRSGVHGPARRLSYVSEETNYAPRAQLADLALFHQAAFPEAWDVSLFRSVLADFGLREERRFGELSRSGRLQASFALAVARRPRILMLDDVVSVLEPPQRSALISRLREAKEGGAAVLVSTQAVSDILSSLDHVFLLEEGRIVFEGEPALAVDRGFERRRRAA